MGGILFQAAADVDAAESGHVHVEEDQVRAHGRQGVERRLAVVEDVGVVSLLHEEPSEDFGHDRLIIHDHHARDQ